MEKVLPAVRKGLREAAELIQEVAVDLAYDARDAVQSGFGVPKLITSIASLSVAAVATAGTASLALDIASRFLVKRDCNVCNGWEGLRCTTCLGRGKVQRRIKSLELQSSDNVSVESLAPALNVDLLSSEKKCPSCDGTGVMKCTRCKGDPWKLQLNIDNVMDPPWKALKIYEKLDPPYERAREDLKDPKSAAFWLIKKPELEMGIKFGDEDKQKILSKYEVWRQHEMRMEDIIEQHVGLGSMLEDSATMTNAAYYAARMQVEAEVSSLAVPPRPSNWMELDTPLRERGDVLNHELAYLQRLQVYDTLKGFDLSQEESENPRRQVEMETLLRAQENVLEGFLNAAWEEHWKREKAEEIIKEKVKSYTEPQEVQQMEPSKVGKKKNLETSKAGNNLSKTVEDKSVGRSSQAKQATQEEKAETVKASEEEIKKKAKKERVDRLAKQAAEREAALAQAKVTKHSSR